eukprot:COSAG04_NODE_20474_length_393_cov_0.530612_1_plen_106_part_10
MMLPMVRAALSSRLVALCSLHCSPLADTARSPPAGSRFAGAHCLPSRRGVASTPSLLVQIDPICQLCGTQKHAGSADQKVDGRQGKVSRAGAYEEAWRRVAWGLAM